MKILSVVGARPNFMKIAPFIRAISILNKENNAIRISHVLVHTGQHYDDRMSRTFFEELSIPEADINLGIGSGSHAEQVGNTMIEFEKVLLNENPDWVVVVGDVNATLACSVTAKKMHIKVCHIEAGLRSGDERMPEEINRLVTDRLSDLLLTPDTIAIENLRKEGVSDNKIRFVGNIMIDTLDQNLSIAKSLNLISIITKNKLESSIIEFPPLIDEKFAVVTLHRPSNVDDPIILGSLVDFIVKNVTKDLIVIWPIHPRTLKHLYQFNLFDQINSSKNIILTHPLGYHDMLRLNMGAKVMLTDSGGLQEECTVLGTPCLTMRWNTERPVTLKEYGGASVLVGTNLERIKIEYQIAIEKSRAPFRPELWDGKTAERCVNSIVSY